MLGFHTLVIQTNWFINMLTIKKQHYRVPLIKIASIFCFILCSHAALASEVISTHIKYKHKTYYALLEMQLDAPAEVIYRLFTDFNNLGRLSETIIESKLISGQPPDYVVEVKTKGCVAMFCKSLRQTQQVTELGDGHIMVEDIPDKSDFRYASTLWHIRSHEKGTRVSFSSEMTPDFWLPPLLGPWMFKKKMLEETRTMLEKLEVLSKSQ